MTSWFLVYTSLFLADVFWVLCIRRVQESDAVMAGVWALAIFLPSAFVTAEYVKDPWLLIPAAIGHFCGTMATVKFEAWRKGRTLQQMVDAITPVNKQNAWYDEEELAYWQFMEKTNGTKQIRPDTSYFDNAVNVFAGSGEGK